MPRPVDSAIETKTVSNCDATSGGIKCEKETITTATTTATKDSYETVDAAQNTTPATDASTKGDRFVSGSWKYQ